MLHALKCLVLRAWSRSGLTRLVAGSRWRQRRLLILGYHGISLDDEHEWDGRMFMPPVLFRQRLQWLRHYRCAVLPLSEALERLVAGNLPPRAVVLTFDDGFFSFYSSAWPALREFGWPATLYLTTYYCLYNRPVFDPAVSYLLWKSRKPVLEWPSVLPGPVRLDLRGRAEADHAIKAYCLAQRLSGAEKDELLNELAGRLGVELAGLSSRRVMQLVSPSEVRELASQGADVQLHTQRHRVPRERERFDREIEDNRRQIAGLTGKTPVHFCYPSGYYRPELPGWLRDLGILSATTCESGLAGRATDAWLLPRLMDGCPVSREEYEGWLSGVASFLPRRPVAIHPGSMLEE